MAEALYDIAEPGASKPKEACAGRAIGIDLGTTNSLVAVVRDANPVALADAAGKKLLPSAVRYRDGEAPVVGADALRDAAQFPRDTIVSAKRFMGRVLADVAGHQRLPYRFVDQPGMVGVQTREGVKTAVEVSAEILATLRFRAEDTFDDDV